MKRVATFFIILSLVLSGCAYIKDNGGSLEKLKEFTENSDGSIELSDREYIPVNVKDLYAVRANDTPYGFLNDDGDNKDGTPFPSVFSIKDVENEEWIYLHQFGEMMGWGTLYRWKDVLPPDFANFNADEIWLSTGDISNPLEDSKIVEMITNIETVKKVCRIISEGKTVDFADKQLTYLRCVFILSSEYKGLAFEYTLQRDAQGNTYLSSFVESDGYDVTEIFDYVDR